MVKTHRYYILGIFVNQDYRLNSGETIVRKNTKDFRLDVYSISDNNYVGLPEYWKLRGDKMFCNYSYGKRIAPVHEISEDEANKLIMMHLLET